jgi:hypothetical protein
MKKIIAIALSFIVALLAAPPMATYAVSSPSVNAAFGTMQVEYRFAEGETPNIPQQIERFGFTFHLVSQTEPVLESSLPVIRTYSYMVSGILSKEQLDEIGTGGATGFTPVNVVMEREVDRVEYLEMNTNDVEDIPLTIKYEVTSGTDPSGFEMAELARTGVTFEILAINDGLPTRFLATVIYRGIETYSEVGYFIAESTFTTDMDEEADLFVVIATYETDEMPPPIVSNVGTLSAYGGISGQDEVEGLSPIEEEQIALQEGEQNPLANIANGNVPLGNLAVAGVWSFLSLVFSIIGVIFAGVCVFGLIAKRKTEKKELRDIIIRVMVIGFGLLTLFTWLLWDNFSIGMVWINENTLLIGVLLAVTAALFIIARKMREKTGQAEKDGHAEQVV